MVSAAAQLSALALALAAVVVTELGGPGGLCPMPDAPSAGALDGATGRRTRPPSPSALRLDDRIRADDDGGRDDDGRVGTMATDGVRGPR